MKPRVKSNPDPGLPTPDPVAPEPAAPDVENLYLDTNDILRIQAAQDGVTIAVMKIGMVQKDGEHDTLQLKVKQEHLQLEQAEYEVRVMKRSETLRHLTGAQGEAIGRYNSLKAELEKKYGISDLQKITYDDITGRVTILPYSTQ